MSDTESTKTRVSPISALEREVLILVIAAEPDISSKEINSRAVFLKNKAWERVTEKFNSLNMGPRRSHRQLQRVWERAKYKNKQQNGYLRKEKTGGSTAPVEQSEETLCSEVDYLWYQHHVDPIPACDNSYNSDMKFDATVENQEEESSSLNSTGENLELTTPVTQKLSPAMTERRFKRKRGKFTKSNETSPSFLGNHQLLVEAQVKLAHLRKEDAEKQKAITELNFEEAQMRLDKQKTVMDLKVDDAKMQLELTRMQIESEKLHQQLLKEQLRQAYLNSRVIEAKTNSMELTND